MHEIDRGVRLQKIAPGALARMRLAGYEQHLQTVADAFGRDDGAVVLDGDLALPRRHGELGVVASAMLDVDRHVDGPPGRDIHRFLRPVIARDRHRRRRAVRLHPLVLDPEGERLRLPDDAEARRPLDDQPPVGLAALAGDQGVQGPLVAAVLEGFRDVVDLAVGHHQRAGIALGRDVGERPVERIEGARSFLVLALAGQDDRGADLGVGEVRRGIGDLPRRVIGGRRAPADLLAQTFVDDEHRDVRQRFAVFLADRRIEERRRQRREGERPQDRAARPAVEGKHERQGGEAEENVRRRFGNEGVPGEESDP